VSPAAGTRASPAGWGCRRRRIDSSRRLIVVGSLVMLSSHFHEGAMLAFVGVEGFEISADLALDLLCPALRDGPSDCLLRHLRRTDVEPLCLGVEIGIDRDADGLLGSFGVVNRRPHDIPNGGYTC